MLEPQVRSGWGAAYFAEDAWTPVAQVVAAVTMLGPVAVEYVICARSACDISILNGSPTGFGVLAYACLLPGSVSNHLACALYRKWVPECQKLDRTGVTIAVVLQSWACSQSVAYTAIAGLLSVSYAYLVTCSPPRFRDNQELATLIVGAIVVYGLLSMQIPQYIQTGQLNPYFFPAAAAVGTGFTVFLQMPVRAWTDAVWHACLTLYAVFTGFWIVKLEREVYGGCSDSGHCS